MVGECRAPGSLFWVSTAPEDRTSPSPIAAENAAAEPSSREVPSLAADDVDAQGIARLAQGSTRRAPRYGRFVGVGVVVGLALAAVITLLGPSGPVLGRDAIFLLLAVAFGTAGALLGGLGAVLVERRQR